MLGEKSSSSDHEKYKILKGGIRGKTKHKIQSSATNIKF